MAKRRYIYVHQYGLLWRFGRRNMKALLRTIVEGKSYNLDDLGTPLGRVVGTLDMGQDEAQILLDRLSKGL